MNLEDKIIKKKGGSRKHNPILPGQPKTEIKRTEEPTVVIEQPVNCQSCGKPKSRIRWNEKGDLLLCKNWACALYGAPQGSLPKNASLKHWPLWDDKSTGDILRKIEREDILNGITGLP